MPDAWWMIKEHDHMSLQDYSSLKWIRIIPSCIEVPYSPTGSAFMKCHLLVPSWALEDKFVPFSKPELIPREGSRFEFAIVRSALCLCRGVDIPPNLLPSSHLRCAQILQLWGANPALRKKPGRSEADEWSLGRSSGGPGLSSEASAPCRNVDAQRSHPPLCSVKRRSRSTFVWHVSPVTESHALHSWAEAEEATRGRVKARF